MILSIVIPVYNVEKYLLRCMDSIVKQSVSDTEFEIVVIDDGSTDNSKQLLRKYENCLNVRIYSQDNHGLSYTRNRGVELSNGKYIFFLDSDDWIGENTLSHLISFLYANKEYDVVVMSDFYVEGDACAYSKPKINIACQTGLQLFETCEYMTPSQFYIYKKVFLKKNNLSFCEGVMHEDNLFTYEMLHKALLITFYNCPVYHFYKHEGSITRSFKGKKTYDLIYIINEILKFKEVTVKAKLARYDKLASLLAACAYNSAKCGDEEKGYFDEFTKCKHELFWALCLSRSFKLRVWGILSFLLPNKCFSIYSALLKLKEG